MMTLIRHKLFALRRWIGEWWPRPTKNALNRRYEQGYSAGYRKGLDDATKTMLELSGRKR